MARPRGGTSHKPHRTNEPEPPVLTRPSPIFLAFTVATDVPPVWILESSEDGATGWSFADANDYGFEIEVAAANDLFYRSARSEDGINPIGLWSNILFNV